MAKRAIGVDLVTIASAFASSRKIFPLFQVGNDSLHGALGDPYSFGDLAKENFRILGDAEKHMGMVAQKGPLRTVR
jgi:hypothetical protein